MCAEIVSFKCHASDAPELLIYVHHVVGNQTSIRLIFGSLQVRLVWPLAPAYIAWAIADK
jgi:hypothetical protein